MRVVATISQDSIRIEYGFLQMRRIITMRTSPAPFTSHHSASKRSCLRDSEYPTWRSNNTIIPSPCLNATARYFGSPTRPLRAASAAPCNKLVHGRASFRRRRAPRDCRAPPAARSRTHAAGRASAMTARSSRAKAALFAMVFIPAWGSMLPARTSAVSMSARLALEMVVSSMVAISRFLAASRRPFATFLTDTSSASSCWRRHKRASIGIGPRGVVPVPFCSPRPFRYPQPRAPLAALGIVVRRGSMAFVTTSEPGPAH
ncbi:hypothetical protein DFH27DRAFT_550938 [Peziza echinospora]|nr:hypothetical protein DFH27DRAFT_550938 [Peziza echinospora]